MQTIDVIDDLSAIIRAIERLPLLVLMGGVLIVSLILRDI
jgi:hypothetical protein